MPRRKTLAQLYAEVLALRIELLDKILERINGGPRTSSFPPDHLSTLPAQSVLGQSSSPDVLSDVRETDLPGSEGASPDLGPERDSEIQRGGN